jgi:hypothetical protein
MLTLARLAATLQPLLTTVADAAAYESGMIRRRGKVTGATFVQTLAFGWLGQPAASLSQLCQVAATCGLAITPQGLDARFTEAAAGCLKRGLAAAMRQALAADPVALPIRRRFNGVYAWDSTTITPPDALAAVWPGCGGRVATNTRAALKVQARWELTTGALELTELHAGRESDRAAADRAAPLPAGALRLTDLGYVSLARLSDLTARGVFALCRLPAHVAAFDGRGRRWVAAALLNRQAAAAVDLPVTLGVAERTPVRLVARRAAPAVAAQRRRAWRKAAKREGRTLSKERLALADWDAYITTVPAPRLSAAEALARARARWQVELLFKLWKSHGRLDEWRSAQPWRVLCEVYAKLLAMLIQHWRLLLRCWADPARSLVKAAAAVRQHALALAAARGRAGRLRAALRGLGAGLAAAGRRTTRKAQPTTAQRLLALVADADPTAAVDTAPEDLLVA